MRFICFLTLIFVATSYSYAFNINHFAIQLEGNDEVSNIQSFVNKRTSEDSDGGGEKTTCTSPFSKTSHCCLDPIEKPEHFEKILSLKMQCAEELGLNATKIIASFCEHNKEEKNKDEKDKEKDKEEKHKEEKNKEEKHKDDKHKEDYVCVMQCVGQKQGIIDESGKIDEIKIKKYIKENLIASEWQHSISDDIVQKCINKFQTEDTPTPVTVVAVAPAPLSLAIAPGTPDTVKVNVETQVPDVDVNKKSKSLDGKKPCIFNGYKMAKCIYREYMAACPVDKQKDTKMCIRVREKFIAKNEKTDCNKKHAVVDGTTVQLTEVKVEKDEIVSAAAAATTATAAAPTVTVVVAKDEKVIEKTDKIVEKDEKDKKDEHN